MNYWRRRIISVPILLALTITAVACGNTKNGTPGNGGAGSSTSGGSVRGVTDTKIRIGGLAGLTSPSGGYAGADLGAKARFERVNKEGGIAGRQIEWVGVSDDAEDPAKNLSEARKLVQQDNVFALAPVIGLGLLPASSNFLEQNKVPFVGWGFMPGFCFTKFGFGFGGCLSPPNANTSNLALSNTVIDYLKLKKGSTVAIVGYDADPGRTAVAQLKGAFEHEGMKVVYKDTTMPTTDVTDFTPWVQKIMTSNDGNAPDVVSMLPQFNNTIGLTGALRAAGYKGATQNYQAYIPGLLGAQKQIASALNGSYVNTQWLPTEFGGEAITQMQKDLTAIGAKPDIAFGTAIGYWSADVLVQMLQKVGKDLTPETFDKVINGGFVYKPWGDPIGIGPVEYPRDHSQPTPCAAMVQATGSEYKPALPMTCFSVVKS
jgi:branched-chain amino acid transport system substrate-binding protein